jgi:hypothetical protein
LLDDPLRLARRDGLAAFKGARAGAASQQQRQCEPDREEGSQALDCGGELIRQTLGFGLRALNSGAWTMDFRLWTLDYAGRRRIGIDGFPEPEPAGVYAPLDVRGLGLGFDRLLFDSHIRPHILFTLLDR